MIHTPVCDLLGLDALIVCAPIAVVPRVVAAILAGGGDEYVPFACQSVGLIHSVEPAAVIIERALAEAEAALARAGGFVRVAA